MIKTLQIPTSWDDITIRQFQQYNEAIGIADSAEQKMRVALHTLCGVEPEELSKLSNKDAQTIITKLAFLSSEPKGNESLVQKITLEGVEYGFIPNWTQLTLGEYVDLEHYTTGHDLTKNLHKAMALMYRPITSTALHQYDIEAYEPNEHRARLMLDMPMSVAVGALVFFYTIGRAFAIDMRSYLNQLKGQSPPTSSGLNGVGIE